MSRTYADRYEVDIEMCGELWDGFDLGDFCDRLQTACDEAGLDVEVVPITGSVNGAKNYDPDTVPDGIWNDTLVAYGNEDA